MFRYSVNECIENFSICECRTPTPPTIMVRGVLIVTREIEEAELLRKQGSNSQPILLCQHDAYMSLCAKNVVKGNLALMLQTE